MQIAIDGRTFGSKPSGIGIYAYNFINELIKGDDSIVILTDVAISGEMKKLKEAGVAIVEYGQVVYRSAGVFKYFDFIIEELNKIQPDIFWEPNIIIPKPLKGFKGKSVITIHDMFPISHREYFGMKYYAYFKIMLNNTLKRCDLILYNSIETKKETEKFFKAAGKVKNEISYIIVPRVDVNNDETKIVSDIEKNNNAVSKSAGLSTMVTTMMTTIKEVCPQGYFLYVGNMERRKGVDLLIYAFKKYCESGGKKSLVLAGKSREKEIDDLIEKYAVDIKNIGNPQDNTGIIYSGYVTDEDKNNLYKNCEALVFPSRAEGFGISVIEAMNYNKKVLCSDLSIFKEIVGDCISYFMYEPDGKESNNKRFGENVNRLAIALEEIESAEMPKTSKPQEAQESLELSHEYATVIDKYSPERLGAKLVEILSNLA